VVALLLTGCSGADSADDSSPSDAAPEGVAGEYDTRVTLLHSTCADITVQDNPTTVDQEAGSDTIELTHAGTTYTAELGDDGQFTTDAVRVEVGPATHSLIVHGTFSGAASFRASVLATVTGGADGPCEYEVSWVAARQ
jgi:hypothetical protein